MTEPGPPATNGLSLASTVHDPDNRFLAHFEAVAGMLRQYQSANIAFTDRTSHQLVAALRKEGVSTISTAAGATGASRRAALAAAMNASSDWILYCDFDRWIHWATLCPTELEHLPSLVAHGGSDPWYVCVGRTERAFETHPEVQRIAESATNRALSLVLQEPVDAIAGAAVMNGEAARLILSESVELTAATDLEWPALINRAFPGRVAAIQVEGLEFETATFHEAEISSAGSLAAWIQETYNCPEAWAGRLRLAADSVAALARVNSATGA